jgi:hypothetical protein
MAQSFTVQSLTTLLSFPFKDPRWKQKCLVGAALFFSGFLTLGFMTVFVLGYVYQILERIILENGEPYLPEWEDWSRLFRDGTRLVGAILVIIAPALFLFLIGFLFQMIPVFTLEFSANHYQTSSSYIPILTLVSLIPYGLGAIISLFTGVLTPVVVGHVVATHSWTAVFRVKEWWKIFRANLGGFVICYVILLGLSFVSALPAQILYFTVILCCLAPFVLSAVSFYICLISYPLYGLTYRAAIQKLSSGPQT